MSRGRYRYTPQITGWVAIHDRESKLVECIDCSAGGAQETFDRRCRELEADGWTLEKRFVDSRFASKPPQRWLIGIYPKDVSKPGEPCEGMYGMTR